MHLYRNLFRFACFLGLAVQLFFVGHSYFRYDTVSDLLIDIPKDIDLPDLSICFRYTDLFNKAAFQNQTNTTLPFIDTDSELNTVQKLVTIKEIFSFTPPTKGIIKSCLFREPASYKTKESSGDDCDGVFSIGKFYLQEYVCYKFSQKIGNDTERFSFEKISYSLSFSGTFYSIRLDLKFFEGAHYFKAMVHSKTTYPYRSAALSPVINRLVNPVTLKGRYNTFDLTYSMLFTTRLPSPYATNCKDYSKDNFTSANDCLSRCLFNKTQERFGKTPFSTILYDQADMKHINVEDLANATISKAYILLESLCANRCSNMDCINDITITKVTYDTHDDNLEFNVNVPREPVFKIRFSPRYPTAEFVVTVSSCLGIWFGFSVLSLNPFGRLSSARRLREKAARTSSETTCMPRRQINLASKIYGDARHGRDFCVATRRKLRVDLNVHTDQIAKTLFSAGNHATPRRVES